VVTSANEFLADVQARGHVLDEYRETGYCILTDVFGPAQLSQMQQAWGQVSDKRRSEGRKAHATLLMTHVSNPDVAKIVRHRPLVDCVESLLGGRVELIQSQLMHGMPGTKGFSPHQDNFYNRAQPNDGIIAAWIALEDVDEENGCLVAFPGSHHHGLAQTRRDWMYLLSRSPDVAKSLLRAASPKFRTGDDDSSVIERFVYAEAPKGIEPAPMIMKAGSVLFMHGDVIHFSYPNRTANRSRRSLLTNFIRTGTVFSAGKLTGRVPFDVYASQG
jgi:ectoine hydroxylase-related dioxygenase (phytanoyl-CoA dioxygenase family)